MAINFKFYTFKLFLLTFGIQLITFICFYSFWCDAMVASAMILIIGYYLHIKINKINKNIELLFNRNHMNRSNIYGSVGKFIEEHNQFCSEIMLINKFWKDIFLVFMITAFPINLTIMHQLLFEDIDLYMRFFYAFIIILDDTILFGLQYSYALFSLKVHKMAKKLSQLQWEINGWPFRMRFKLKILMCFERLAHKKKFGMTIGSVVVTFPLFQQVQYTLIA